MYVYRQFFPVFLLESFFDGVKCKCIKVLYSVWQGLPILRKMEHSFAKNSLERENLVVSFIFENELYRWVKHGLNQRTDFKVTLISQQTVLFGWFGFSISMQKMVRWEGSALRQAGLWVTCGQSLTPVVQLTLESRQWLLHLACAELLTLPTVTCPCANHRNLSSRQML